MIAYNFKSAVKVCGSQIRSKEGTRSYDSLHYRW